MKNKHLLFFPLLILFFQLYWATLYPSSAESTGFPKCPPYITLSEPISDPRAWTLQCLGNSSGQNIHKPDDLIEFEADMNHDGIPELFISTISSQGNAGGEYFVFRKDGDQYSYLGFLFLHPKAFKVLPMEGDQRPKMVLYRRSGCCQGSLITVKYTGTQFVVVSQEIIHPVDRDRERYRELFGD
jgi:hypothetical protein